MRQRVAIIGAGGFGREVLDIFEACNKQRDEWEILGFIDDDPLLRQRTVRGYPVVGGSDWLSTPQAENVKTVVAIGDNAKRKRIVERVKGYGVKFCNIIHPSTISSNQVELGEGVIIAAGCIFTNNIKIGNHVIINLGVTLGHDTVIEDFVNLNPGVHVNGNNKILEGAYVGSGAVTIQSITIGQWAVIGAGAVIIRDAPKNSVSVGVPAKVIKELEK